MTYPTRQEVTDVLKSRGHKFKNLSFFPGTNPDVTAEQIADTIEKALIDIALGNGTDIDLDY